MIIELVELSLGALQHGVGPVPAYLLMASLGSVGWAAVVWCTAFFDDYRRRAEAEQLQLVVRRLARLLAGGAEPSGEELAKLSARRQFQAIARAADSIAGSELKRLRRLARKAGTVELASAALKSRRWGRRVAGIAVFESLALPDLKLADLLADPHPTVRLAALRWLTRLDLVPDYTGPLVALLDDDDGMVRTAAQDAFAFARIASVEPLIQALGSDLTDRQQLALLQIARRMNDALLARSALPMIDHPSPEIRAAATLLLGRHDVPEFDLAVELEGGHPLTRRAAIVAAGDRQDPVLAGPVGRHYHDPDWRTSDSAIESLHQLGSAGAVIIRRLARQPTLAGADAE